MATPNRPLYRVLEMVRDARGRLQPVGRIWHQDLERTRRFGHAIAANTASHLVLIADSAGTVLEELPVCDPDERHVDWGGWTALPVPPLPPAPPPRRLPGVVPARSRRRMDADAPHVVPRSPPVLDLAVAAPAPAARRPPADVPVLPLPDAVARPG